MVYSPLSIPSSYSPLSLLEHLQPRHHVFPAPSSTLHFSSPTMVSPALSARHLFSVFSYHITPIAARFLPIISNCSSPMPLPAVFNSSQSIIPLTLDLSTASTSSSSYLSICPSPSLATASISFTTASSTSSQLSTLAPAYFTSTTSPGLNAVSTPTTTSSASSQLSTFTTYPSSELTSSFSPLSTSQSSSQSYAPPSSSFWPISPPPFQISPSPSPPYSSHKSSLNSLRPFNTTHLGLIVGFSLFGLAILVCLVLWLARKSPMPYNRRRESQSHVEAIATPKQPQSQSSRGAAGGSGDVVVTLDASCAKEGRIEEIQTKEIKHMIKSPWLEAWKKGVVPMLEPQKTSDDGEGANVEGGNEAIGSAL